MIGWSACEQRRGKVTVDEFALLAKAMKAAYPDPKFLPDNDAKTVWYEMLKDLPYEQVSRALKRHMQSNRFPPTIADLRTQTEEGESVYPTATEAWAIVYKAICNSSYHADEEYAKLPPLLQRAVGHPGNLKEWSLMDIDTVQSVEQSHFIRAYNAVLETARHEAKISPDARARIGASYQSRIEG